jgi:hypothetical protein
MILIGTHVDHPAATAYFVILEKTLKNVRHYYDVKDARQSAAPDCRDMMAAFYNDNAYTIRKRIYSQDRRPRKDVSARPTLVMAAGRREDLPLIQALRCMDVPVEAVFIKADDCPPDPARAGIGKNHAATEKMIYETLTLVQAQARLAPLTGAENPLLENLSRMMATPGQNGPLLLAAAAPVWFRENVKYSSAYRTSATSIRKYR